MTKNYKILLAVCSIVIACNIFGKFVILDEQAYKISVLQKVLTAARSETGFKMEKKSMPAQEEKQSATWGVEQTLGNIPAVLSLTELAAKLRLLIDKNQLTVKDSLVFRPEKTKMPALVKYHTQVSVNGEYGNIKGFISDLQNVPELLYLESVKIVRTADNEPLLKLSLGISLFSGQILSGTVLHEDREKKYYFAAALGLFILSIAYRLMNPYVQPRVTRLTYTGKGQETYKVAGVKGAVEKRAEPRDSGEAPKTSRRVYRDLFSVYKPPQKGEKKKRASITTPPDKAVETAATDPLGAIMEYIASYKFYGTYASGDQKAVFLARDKLVLVARTGDRIDGKYEIDDIQDEFIRIKALELNETIDINIREFNND